MFSTKGYAAHAAQEPLKPFSFERRDPTPNDVQIEILFCGVCHSDIHIARNEWGGTTSYPCVPGHEIVGRVVKVGRDVKKFKEGDLAAVGCMVDSAAYARTARQTWSSSAIRSRSSPTTVRMNTPAGSLTADIPRALWWTRISCFEFPINSISLHLLPSSAPASRLIRRSAFGKWARARKWAWLVWVASAIWPSNLPTPSVLR